MKNNSIARRKRDPVAFTIEALVNPETSKPFELYPEQVNLCAQRLTPLLDGSLPTRKSSFHVRRKAANRRSNRSTQGSQTYTISTRQALRCSQP